MANRGAPSKNVIYDSNNDTSSGRKRAVEFTGGVSVAERARLFGTQINHSSVPKVNKPDNRNHQRVQSESNQNYSYSSAQRPPNTYRSGPSQNYDRPNRNEQPPPPPPPPLPSSSDSHDYSIVNRAQKQQQQQSRATYQSVVYSTPQKQNQSKSSYTSVAPGESYTTDDEVYYESQRRQQQRQRRQTSPSHNQNYFKPIRDPLEVLYTQTSFGSSQPSLSTDTRQNTDGMLPFDLGNLIGRIQQDYLNNARPYVSSIQFIENPQNPLAVNRQGFPQDNSNRTTNDLYLRPGASYHYDVIDTSQFLPTYVRPMQTQNHQRRHHHHREHSSMRRKQHRGHYRDRASSPIGFVEKPKTPSPPPKPPTPVEEKPETPEETEEEETVNTKTEERTAEDATSEEEEEEEEEEEQKPAVVVPSPSTTATTSTAIVNQRPGLVTGTPTIATRLPPAQNESSSSESEESESSSESDSDDSDDSDKGKRKKKSKPPVVPVSTPASARTNTRTTPQLNNRTARQPATPTMKTVTNKTDDPPEVSNSVKSFNTQESTKSPGIRGKFSSLASKFRRKKS